MFEMISLVIAIAILSFRYPGLFPAVGAYAAGAGFAVAATALDIWQFVRRAAIWLFWVFAFWLSLLVFAVWLGHPVVMGAMFVVGILMFTLSMLALLTLRRVTDWTMAAIESLATAIDNALPITGTVTGLNWWQKALAAIPYGVYLLFALPIVGTARILRMASAVRPQAERIFTTLISAVASLNIVSFFLLMLVIFQTQHGEKIVDVLLVGMVYGALVLLLALANLGVAGLAGWPRAYVTALGIAALTLMGVVVWTHYSPASTREVALHLKNAKKRAMVGLRIGREGPSITGRVYYRATVATTMKSCHNCVVGADGRFLGTVGTLLEIPTGTLLVSVGDEEEIEVDAVLWRRVHKAVNNDPRKGFDTRQIWLVYKDDLERSARPEASQATIAPASAAANAPRPWWYYGIAAAMLMLFLRKPLVGLFPAGRLQNMASIAVWITVAVLAVKAVAAMSIPTSVFRNPIIVSSLTHGGIRPATLPPDAAALVATYAAKHGVPVDLMSAIVWTESRGNLNAPDGASGEICAMQIMPATARAYGVANPADLRQPDVCFDTGARILRANMDKYMSKPDGLAKVALAYNYPAAAEKYADVPWSQIPVSALAGTNARGVRYDSYAYVAGILNFQSAAPGVNLATATPASVAVNRGGFSATPNGWRISAPANQLTPLAIRLEPGRYRVRATGKVTWDPHSPPVGPDGGASRPRDYTGGSDFFAPDELVGKPVLLLAGNESPIGLGTEQMYEVNIAQTLTGAAVNDRRTGLSDNTGSFDVTIEKTN